MIEYLTLIQIYLLYKHKINDFDKIFNKPEIKCLLELDERLCFKLNKWNSSLFRSFMDM